MKCSVCNRPMVFYGKFWACVDCRRMVEAAAASGTAGGDAEGALARRLKRRIFLSYGHDEHEPLAERLTRDLREHGHEVWFDLERLQPGEDWEQCIERGLEWAAVPGEDGCIVLLMTPHSVRRPNGYCLNEIAAALTKGIPPIPVMVAQVEPPLSIARIQWFDMTTCVPLESAGAFYEDRLPHLVDALETGNLEFEGNHTRLLKLLDPLEFEAEKSAYLSDFTGREWILDEVREWLDDSAGSRVFWLTGAPGVGKTALCVWLAGRKLPAIKAWHLCQHNDDRYKDPRRCVMSLAYYLSALIPDYFRELIRAGIEKDADKSAGTLFDLLFVRPLARLAPPKERIVILIDGLDEATQKDGTNELAELIGQRFHLVPEWLRLFITSRPVAEVACWLTDFRPRILSTTDPENEKDIEEYARKRFKQLAVPEESIQAAASEIVRRSKGVFLYAEYVCKQIADNSLDVSRPETFPDGLGSIYLGFFCRQFPDGDEYESLFAPVFGMTAAAREPLQLDDLRRHLGWSQRQERKFRDSLGGLFNVSERGLQPFHKSVIDWLTGDAHEDYFVGLKDGQLALAEWGWGEYRKEGAAGLSRYFLKHLPAHLTDCRQWERLTRLLCDLTFIEVKTQAGLVVELAEDYSRAIAGLPADDPQRRMLTPIEKAIREDLPIISRQPSALLRCLWRRCS